MTYLIVTIKQILDQEAFDEYARRVRPIIQSFGGEYVAIEPAAETKSGSWPYVRTVLATFPSIERAQQWYDSPEYQEIIPLRLKAIDANIVLARGLAETKAAKAA